MIKREITKELRSVSCFKCKVKQFQCIALHGAPVVDISQFELKLISG